MTFSRREVLGNAAAALGAAAVSARAGDAQAQRSPAAQTRPVDEPFGYCLNTSTIRGNNLDLVGVVNAAAKAGFHAIEPWIIELDSYTASGGTLKDLGNRIADAGLTVEDVIAFNSFLEDDDARRSTSMEKLKADMDKVAQIGGKRIAAPPGTGGRRREPRQRREVLPRGARSRRKRRRAALARAMGYASCAWAVCRTAST
jgi:sugar phosphate isomerase/epimerase